jgi:hypothetical protein
MDMRCTVHSQYCYKLTGTGERCRYGGMPYAVLDGAGRFVYTAEGGHPSDP